MKDNKSGQKNPGTNLQLEILLRQITCFCADWEKTPTCAARLMGAALLKKLPDESRKYAVELSRDKGFQSPADMLQALIAMIFSIVDKYRD